MFIQINICPDFRYALETFAPEKKAMPTKQRAKTSQMAEVEMEAKTRNITQ